MARCRPGSRSGCPVAYALDVVGDQWTLLVVRDLLLTKKRTFREFLESPERMATNVLADRLERLEGFGIVVRVLDPDDRRRSRYYLTDKGLDLFPAMLELVGWSLKHDPATVATKALVAGLRAGAEGMAARHRDERETALREQPAERQVSASRSAADSPPPRRTSDRSSASRGGRARR